MANTQLKKTTVVFNALFHRRLKLWANRTNRNMSQVIEDELLPILEAKQLERQKRVVAGLRGLTGVINDPNMADAAATADDYLYGSKAFENPMKREQNAK